MIVSLSIWFLNKVLKRLIKFNNSIKLDELEIMWRIYDLTLQEIYPSVYNLHLHILDQQMVAFCANEDLNDILNSYFSANSMLTEFLLRNRVKKMPDTFCIKNFPRFLFRANNKKIASKKKIAGIGWIVTSPFKDKRYYIWILLNHISGPLSFDYRKIICSAITLKFHKAANSYLTWLVGDR